MALPLQYSYRAPPELHKHHLVFIVNLLNLSFMLATRFWARSFRHDCSDIHLYMDQFEAWEGPHLEANCGIERKHVQLPLDLCIKN